MGIVKTYVSPIKERKKKREKQSKSECEKERKREREVLPRCFDFTGKKSPNNLAHVSLEKMRAAKNAYNIP